MTINGRTALYGIIGNPVSHSLSPAMHNAAFAELGENSVYLPFPLLDLEAGIVGLKAIGVKGVSVTIPYKEAVIPLLDEIEDVARQIGAVNTLVIKDVDGKKRLCGSNTDWLGANRALSEKVSLRGAQVVLLGAGGSARAIGFGLQKEGAQVVLCSRTESRGLVLAADLGCLWHPLDDAESLHGDILVNATSVGMQPEIQLSPVSKAILSRFQVVMDIVYAPLVTRLLSEARAAGCQVINGLEMLLYQGVAQFELWTGKTAPVELMRQKLYQATGNTLTNAGKSMWKEER
ncbi:MAG: shikimate dehydrogenase [Proteobacteria bacterium]|nr:shikimate dehydrogenase [Pseudomonadota bacterium]MBU1647868.1 shikimate dehydrogenase [Pseudomonadota bacterium]MBU1985612.1 shikimate dehydrogenase [Pseudomonadota bacterium]